MKWKHPLCLIALLSVISLHCKKNSPAEETTRSFYMGVTPWPADFSIAEVDTSYQFINEHCDIVSHHFDEGIPYEEMFTNAPFPTELQNDIQYRKFKTAPGKKILLSMAAVDISRQHKADYYSKSTVTDSIKNRWRNLPPNDPKVITAYVNFVGRMIDFFQPLYVNYGVESNSALWNAPDFLQYKSFIQQVYQQLKLKYPSLILMASFMVDETNEGFTNATQLLPYTDFVALSAYPYVTVSSSAGGSTDPALFPANYLQRWANLSSAGKPLVFSETGYIAENLTIPAFSLNKQGNTQWQQQYLETVCRLCQQYNAKMLIWFCSKDYDAAVNTMQSLGIYQDIFGLWKDTGLKDQAGRKRPAFDTWIKWMTYRRAN